MDRLERQGRAQQCCAGCAHAGSGRDRDGGHGCCSVQDTRSAGAAWCHVQCPLCSSLWSHYTPTLTAPADPSREVLIESRVPAQLIRRLTPGTVALQVALAPLARVGMY